MLDLRSSLRLIPALLLAVTGCSLRPVPANPHRTAHLPRQPHRSASTTLTGSPVPATMPRDLTTAATVPPPQPLLLPLFPAAAAAAKPRQTSLQVIGLPQPDVRRMLGPPTTSSTRGAGQVWTYHRADCSVEIAFYYDVTRSGFFALSQQLTSGGEDQDCLVNVHDDNAS